MGLWQERTNLNSLHKDARQRVVLVVLLYLYLKLVVVDKGCGLLWKRMLSCLVTAIYDIAMHVDLSAFGLLRQHEQVHRSRYACG
jgi:hypothetical protein